MARLVTLLALASALASAPALADDETSEHTAQLFGASIDQLGVTVSFVEGRGWSMDVRPKPGADVITTQLALPIDHGHYVVYVAPGRASIAFVEVSAGRGPTAKDTIGWVYSPDGKLLRSWTFGAVVDAAELEETQASTSHFSVIRDVKLTQAGLEFRTRVGGRGVVLAADATTFQ